MIAGRDTTANALTWTLYELSRHPDVISTLRDEIDVLNGMLARVMNSLFYSVVCGIVLAVESYRMLANV